MNWEATAAVAEIVAAIVLIILMLYVARQTRKNTREVARGYSRQTYADHATALRPLVESAELSELLVRG